MKEPTMFPEVVGGARILLAADIRNLVRSHRLIDPFLVKNLASCAYDFSVGTKSVVAGQGVEKDIRESALVLGPGEYAGFISHEKVVLPANICVSLGPKRRLAYDGIILLSGSIIHPGYEGHLLFVLFNSSGCKRPVGFGRKICSAVFYQLDRDVEDVVGVDPELASGTFPQDFLNSMANMELPSLIEVTQKLQAINALESRIVTLERNYSDVTEPIRTLVKTVKEVSRDVELLTEQGRQIFGKIEEHESAIVNLGKSLAKQGVWISVVWTLIVVLLTAILSPLVGRLAASKAETKQVVPSQNTESPTAPAAGQPADTRGDQNP